MDIKITKLLNEKEKKFYDNCGLRMKQTQRNFVSSWVCEDTDLLYLCKECIKIGNHQTNTYTLKIMIANETDFNFLLNILKQVNSLIVKKIISITIEKEYRSINKVLISLFNTNIQNLEIQYTFLSIDTMPIINKLVRDSKILNLHLYKCNIQDDKLNQFLEPPNNLLSLQTLEIWNETLVFNSNIINQLVPVRLKKLSLILNQKSILNQGLAEYLSQNPPIEWLNIECNNSRINISNLNMAIDSNFNLCTLIVNRVQYDGTKEDPLNNNIKFNIRLKELSKNSLNQINQQELKFLNKDKTIKQFHNIFSKDISNFLARKSKISIGERFFKWFSFEMMCKICNIEWQLIQSIKKQVN